MKIEIDIDGVILDYESVLKTYGDLYDFIEIKKDGIINRNEHYLRNRYDWTDEERMNFINKYFLELSMKTPLILGANKLIIISAIGGMIEEMKDVAIEKFEKEGIYLINIIGSDVCKKLSSNGIKTIYFRDKEMKVLEQNENLKEVSNWGEIYRYIKEMQIK